MTLGDLWKAVRICYWLLKDCSRIDVEPGDEELVARCIYWLCRNEIEALMSLYWGQVRRVFDPGSGKEGRRHKALRLWMVLRLLSSCGNGKCARRTERGLDRLSGQCSGCSERFYALRSGGSIRKIVRRYLLQETQRLVVSTLLDRIALPALSEAMEVEIDEEILQGCTLWLLAREIMWSDEPAMHRLSIDLADLVTQLVRAAGGDAPEDHASLGSGQWVLSGMYVEAQRCWDRIPEAAPVVREWPSFPAEWREIGERMCEAYPLKFNKQLDMEGRQAL